METTPLKTLRPGSNRWTAKLAALLFVVQMLLLGFSMGANASPMPRDQFGNVICSSMGGESGHEGTGDHHAGPVDCCTLGCSVAAGALAPPPPFASLLLSQPLVRSVPFVLYEDVGSGAVETPRQTRGPPASA